MSSCSTFDGRKKDPFLWLEEVKSKRAMAFVKGQNKKTIDNFAKGEDFSALLQEVMKIAGRKDKIPLIGQRGGLLYNFWRDRDHQKGLWRRTTLQSYLTKNPEWEVLLDVDALAKKGKKELGL